MSGMVVAPRRPTRRINVGDVPVGQDAPVSIQSMTNTPTSDVEATLKQIRALAAAGCEVVRVSVPDEKSLKGFAALRRDIRTPLIADIHYDSKLAVGSLDAGADAVRINPGNIGSDAKIREVIDCAGNNGASVRIGVNAGSLEKDILKKHGHPGPVALVESALRSVERVERMGFYNMKLSVKASDPVQTVEAYRLLSDRTDYPLHLGVTEAGTPMTGSVRTAVALSILLSEGIGDTIRVSLAGDPVTEIYTANEILRSLGLKTGIQIVACPTCARAEVDVAEVAAEVERRTRDIKLPLKVAVMGCPVNGPGEARESDVGIAGGKGSTILFVKGKVKAKLSPDEALDALMVEIEKFKVEG